MITFNTSIFKANDYSNPEYIGSKFRKKRFRFFEENLKILKKPITILDLGGTVRFWVDENYHQKDVVITVLNLGHDVSDYPNIKVMCANACDLSFLGNDSFDVAFSNSVIEHLYSRENQIKMANEAMRVGKYYFIQTPNLYFPIEPHFKFPFFQFLPRWFKLFLQTETSIINGAKYDRQYAENIIEEIRLLSRKDMEKLFPESNLHVERFLGLTKSFVSHNFPQVSQ